MIRHFSAALLLSFLVLSPLGQAQDAVKTPPAEKLAANIAYREEQTATDDMRQKCRLDVSYPEDRKGFATVVWFHGGSITSGSRSVPKALQGKGIAVVAVSYRLSPHVTAPAYVEDAAAAIAWTFKHIQEYGGDPKKIYLSGHSAGGYLGMMVALDKKWLKPYGIDANQIAGLVPFSGQAITHFTVRAERGIPNEQPVVDDMAPLNHVRKDAPRMLLITGDREKELLGRYEENAYLWRMMKVCGQNKTDLVELKGYDHGGMAEPAFPYLLKFIGEQSAK